MNRKPVRILALGILTVLAIGCDADAPTPPGLPDTEIYHEPTAPDSVFSNLVLAHRQEDNEAYAALLAPEFRFYFVSQDAALLGEAFWTKSQDLAGTAAMFAASIDIGLVTGHTSPEPADPGLFPPGTMKIHLMNLQFTVEEPNNVTWFVDTEQNLFFRPGNTALGEDADHWFLLEWHELEPVGAPLSGGDPTPVSPTTWGRLKHLFL
ncbi:MAG TPA: hypothetical protein VFP10_15200 [Candidatus Eisenbacteria bacterium]|nr:hypothetical protein [Candidatus Eisenbacteria bacterium]